MAEDTDGRAGVVWDTAAMRRHNCDVANAAAAGDAVVVNFGARRSGRPGVTELQVELLQRIVLRPLTARHLHDMLGKLLAEADAKGNRPE